MWTGVVSLVTLFTATNACQGVLEDVLQKDLLSSYNRMVIPTTTDDPVVNVEHGLFPLKIDNFEHDTLRLNAWVFLSWHDHRLRWNPKEYNNIQKTNVFADSVWTPDVTFWHSGHIDKHTISNIRVSAENSGLVTYVLPTHISSLCDQSADGEMYACVFKAGSWTYDASKLDIDNTGKVLDLSEYREHPDWAITNSTVVRHDNVYACCPDDTYPDVTYTIELERRHHRHHHCN